MVWYLKAWLWLKKNWKWLLLPVGIVLFLVGRVSKKTRKIEVVSPELVGAGEEKGKLLVELSDEITIVEKEKVEKLQKIEKEHAETVKKLTEDQKKEADSLREDPDALQEYLLQVGKDVRSG